MSEEFRWSVPDSAFTKARASNVYAGPSVDEGAISRQLGAEFLFTTIPNVEVTISRQGALVSFGESFLESYAVASASGYQSPWILTSAQPYFTYLIGGNSYALSDSIVFSKADLELSGEVTGEQFFLALMLKLKSIPAHFYEFPISVKSIGTFFYSKNGRMINHSVFRFRIEKGFSWSVAGDTPNEIDQEFTMGDF